MSEGMIWNHKSFFSLEEWITESINLTIHLNWVIVTRDFHYPFHLVANCQNKSQGVREKSCLPLFAVFICHNSLDLVHFNSWYCINVRREAHREPRTENGNFMAIKVFFKKGVRTVTFDHLAISWHRLQWPFFLIPFWFLTTTGSPFGIN